MFNNELFLLKYGKYMKQLLSIKEKALKIVKSVRGSTAAGINPCVRKPPPEYMSSGCHGIAAAGDFPMRICRWCRLGKGPLFGVCWISGSAVWGRASFPWRLYGISRWCYTGRGLFPWCLWHSAHSVPERGLWCTEWTRGAQNSLLWYRMRFQRLSVQKTSFWCTEWKFGAKKGLLVYATRFKDSYRRFRQKFVSCVTIEYGPYGRETEPPI